MTSSGGQCGASYTRQGDIVEILHEPAQGTPDSRHLMYPHLKVHIYFNALITESKDKQLRHIVHSPWELGVQELKEASPLSLYSLNLSQEPQSILASYHFFLCICLLVK